MAEELQGVNIEKQRRVNASFGASFSEIGSTGLERYGGTIYEEFLTALEMPACLKVYKEMSMNDATIGAILFVAEQFTGYKTIFVRIKYFHLFA